MEDRNRYSPSKSVDCVIKSVTDLCLGVKKNLECAICLDLLCKPVSTKCNHQFCKDCIDQAFSKGCKVKGSIKCPMCNALVSKRSLNDKPELGRIVDAVNDVIMAFEKDTELLGVPTVLPCSQRRRLAAKHVEKASKLVKHIQDDVDIFAYPAQTPNSSCDTAAASTSGYDFNFGLGSSPRRNLRSRNKRRSSSSTLVQKTQNIFESGSAESRLKCELGVDFSKTSPCLPNDEILRKEGNGTMKEERCKGPVETKKAQSFDKEVEVLNGKGIESSSSKHRVSVPETPQISELEYSGVTNETDLFSGQLQAPSLVSFRPPNPTRKRKAKSKSWGPEIQTRATRSTRRTQGFSTLNANEQSEGTACLDGKAKYEEDVLFVGQSSPKDNASNSPRNNASEVGNIANIIKGSNGEQVTNHTVNPHVSETAEDVVGREHEDVSMLRPSDDVHSKEESLKLLKVQCVQETPLVEATLVVPDTDLVCVGMTRGRPDNIITPADHCLDESPCRQPVGQAEDDVVKPNNALLDSGLPSPVNRQSNGGELCYPHKVDHIQARDTTPVPKNTPCILDISHRKNESSGSVVSNSTEDSVSKSSEQVLVNSGLLPPIDPPSVKVVSSNSPKTDCSKFTPTRPEPESPQAPPTASISKSESSNTVIFSSNESAVFGNPGRTISLSGFAPVTEPQDLDEKSPEYPCIEHLAEQHLVTSTDAMHISQHPKPELPSDSVLRDKEPQLTFKESTDTKLRLTCNITNGLPKACCRPSVDNVSLAKPLTSSPKNIQPLPDDYGVKKSSFGMQYPSQNEITTSNNVFETQFSITSVRFGNRALARGSPKRNRKSKPRSPLTDVTPTNTELLCYGCRRKIDVSVLSYPDKDTKKSFPGSSFAEKLAPIFIDSIMKKRSCQSISRSLAPNLKKSGLVFGNNEGADKRSSILQGGCTVTNIMEKNSGLTPLRGKITERRGLVEDSSHMQYTSVYNKKGKVEQGSLASQGGIDEPLKENLNETPKRKSHDRNLPELERGKMLHRFNKNGKNSAKLYSSYTRTQGALSWGNTESSLCVEEGKEVDGEDTNEAVTHFREAQSISYTIDTQDPEEETIAKEGDKLDSVSLLDDVSDLVREDDQVRQEGGNSKTVINPCKARAVDSPSPEKLEIKVKTAPRFDEGLFQSDTNSEENDESIVMTNKSLVTPHVKENDNVIRVSKSSVNLSGSSRNEEDDWIRRRVRRYRISSIYGNSRERRADRILSNDSEDDKDRQDSPPSPTPPSTQLPFQKKASPVDVHIKALKAILSDSDCCSSSARKQEKHLKQRVQSPPDTKISHKRRPPRSPICAEDAPKKKKQKESTVRDSIVGKIKRGDGKNDRPLVMNSFYDNEGSELHQPGAAQRVSESGLITNPQEEISRSRNSVALHGTVADNLVLVPIKSNWSEEEKAGEVRLNKKSSMPTVFLSPAGGTPRKMSVDSSISQRKNKADVKSETLSKTADMSETHNVPKPSETLSPMEIKDKNSSLSYILTPSRLNRQQMLYCKALCDRIGGTFSPEFTENTTTHLVMSTDESMAIQRDSYTYKYMIGLVSGTWIVSFKWVLACLKAGKFVDENLFQVKGDLASKHEYVPRLAKEAEDNKANGLLDGYSLIISGSFDKCQVTKDQLMKTAKRCGAQIITKRSFSDLRQRQLIVTDGSDENLIQDSLRNGMTVVTHEWIIENVLNFRVQDPMNFLPKLNLPTAVKHS